MSLVNLVKIEESVLSSYGISGGTGGERSKLRPLYMLGKAGVAVKEVADALLKLSNAVAEAGGDFRVTECHRDVNVQKLARQKYDNWVAAGKPKPGSAGWDASKMKSSFVSRPGRSGHNAGRSIDIHIGMLNFPNTPANKQLDKLWEIAIPLGWSPVIKSADERASESWHFDYKGELSGVFDRLGYEQWALCGAILVGHGDLSGYNAELQALLSRSGFYSSKIDGHVGPKSLSALEQALNLSPAAALDAVSKQDKQILNRLLALKAK